MLTDRIRAVGTSPTPPTAQNVEAALLGANWNFVRPHLQLSDELFREYVRFLSLKVTHGDLKSELLAPPPELETAWHIHSRTHAIDHYNELCEAILPRGLQDDDRSCKTRSTVRRLDATTLYCAAWGHIPAVWRTSFSTSCTIRHDTGDIVCSNLAPEERRMHFDSALFSKHTGTRLHKVPNPRKRMVRFLL